MLSKAEAKLLSSCEVRSALDRFLSPDNEERREERRAELARQLRQLLQLMLCLTSYRFVSSSVLLAYGTCPRDGHEVVRASVIDFAHTFALPSHERQVDENYVSGLRSLLSFLQ